MRTVPAAPASTRPTASDFSLDLTGFLLGIGLAWALGWQTTDLVWGLWLSSLVIGYATIVLGIARARTAASSRSPAAIGSKLFLLVFFTVHFGMFHFVHSLFLNMFFPVLPEPAMQFVPGLAGYGHVFATYWPWLAVAAIAERRTLLAAMAPQDRVVGAVGAVPPASGRHGFNPMQPYANVVRMHLLIFFFAGTAALGLHGFGIYAVVYAVYFWPWRRAPRRFEAAGEPAGTAAG